MSGINNTIDNIKILYQTQMHKNLKINENIIKNILEKKTIITKN